jgi:hypothetical protein
MVIAIFVIPCLFLARTTKWIIIPEAIAVGVFGLYWIIKGREIKKSNIHQDLIEGRLYIKYGLKDIINCKICVKRREPAKK